MPWSSSGAEPEFGQTFRHFVTGFRRISARFRFEWAPAIGGRVDPARSYPGDAYVDIIGIDAYYNFRYDSTDAATAWSTNVLRPYGFDLLKRYAEAHRKPTAYGEWGVMSPE